MHASISLKRAFALVISLLLASALVVTTSQQADAATRSDVKVKKAMKVAKKQVGEPYVYGATGPGSFDCSGLTTYAYGKAGFKLPRTSGSQAASVRRIKRSNMRRGDLIFFHSGGSVYHVGIYWGTPKGKKLILHAPSSGQNVSYSKIWTDSWFPGTVRKKGSKPVKLAQGGSATSSTNKFKSEQRQLKNKKNKKRH